MSVSANRPRRRETAPHSPPWQVTRGLRRLVDVHDSSQIRHDISQFDELIYADLKVASTILMTPCQNEQDVEDGLSKLSVKVAAPVPTVELEAAERAV